MRFCEWLRTQKQLRELTYLDLSHAIGCSESSVGNHVNGHNLPGKFLMEKYFSLFGIPSDKWTVLRDVYKEIE